MTEAESASPGRSRRVSHWDRPPPPRDLRWAVGTVGLDSNRAREGTSRRGTGHYIGTKSMEVMPTVDERMKTTTVWPNRSERRARLNTEVARLLDVLDRHDHEHADIDQVWLIGSTVDADADLRSTSDIDLVVVQRTTESPVDRGLSLRRELAATEPLDLFVYTPAEFGRAERFVEHVRRHGSRVR